MQASLSGLRILDLSDERGFLCGRILADLGADVVKIEPPQGDPVRRSGPFIGSEPDRERSIPWLAYNASKRGITLALATPRGREILDALCSSADALIESYDAPARRDARLQYETLARDHPHLVVCSITSFGITGPRSTHRASDISAVGTGGNMALTGDADRAPLRCTMPTSYFHAGAEAAAGTLVALLARGRIGRGQLVDVSLQETMLSTIMTGAAQWALDPRERRRTGALYQVGRTLQREVWRCKDGFVTYGLRGGPARLPGLRATAQWMAEEGFASPAWADQDWTTYNHNDLSQAEVDALSEPLSRFFSGKTRRELFAGAKARGVMLAPVNDSREIAESEQLRAREFFCDVDDVGRGLRYRLPARFAIHSTLNGDVRSPAPLLGEHNPEVYASIGIDARAIAALREAAIV